MRTWDESLYALRAKEMYLSRSYIVPIQGGEVAWSSGKPPFGFWVILLSFHLLGFTPLALRLPFATFGMGCVLLLFLIGKQLRDQRLGLFSALGLLLMPGFLTYSRQAILEPILTFFFLAALFLYHRSHLCDSKKAILLYSLATGLTIGLALLTKQVVGLLILPALMGHEVWDWRKHRGNGHLFRSFLILLAMLATSVWWFLIMYAQYGSIFVHHYFGTSVLRRLSHTITAADRMAQGFHSVLLQRTGSLPLLLGVLGLLLLLLFLFLPQLLRRGEPFSPNPASHPLLIPLLLFSGIYYLIFGLISRTLLSWYPLPLLPILALGQAYFLWICLEAPSKRGFRTIISTLGLFLITAYFCGLARVALKARTYHSPDPFKEVAAVVKTLRAEQVLFDERIERGHKDKILPLRFYLEVPVQRTDVEPYLKGEKGREGELVITSRRRWAELRGTASGGRVVQHLPGGDLILWEGQR